MVGVWKPAGGFAGEKVGARKVMDAMTMTGWRLMGA